MSRPRNRVVSGGLSATVAPSADDPNWVDIPHARRIAGGCSRSTIYRHKAELPHVLVKGRIRLFRPAVEQLARSRGVEP